MNKQIIQPVKLHDKQWEELQPILFRTQLSAVARAKDNRLFIDAILYVVYTRTSWSKLPTAFGNWNPIYVRFRRWHTSGFWHYLAEQKIQDESLRFLLDQLAKYGDQHQKNIQKRSRS
jgi:hypothetical protein